MIGSYVKQQYENNKFISLGDFDSYIANKANAGTNINIAAIAEVARQLNADEIARGCQLDDTLCAALNVALEDCTPDVAPYRSITLNVKNGNRALLQIHEKAHFPDEFNPQEYAEAIKARLHNTDIAMKYHVVAIPMGIANPWDSFGILIPEPVLYHHMYILKQDFWRQLVQLNNPKVHEVLKSNKELAQIMSTNHWVP